MSRNSFCSSSESFIAFVENLRTNRVNDISIKHKNLHFQTTALEEEVL